MKAWAVISTDDGKILLDTVRKKKMDAVDAFLRTSGISYSRSTIDWAMKQFSVKAVKVLVKLELEREG